MKLSPGVRFGPYDVVEHLGASGMGEVYRARDTKLGRDVAIKVLPPALAGDPERMSRFRHEAQVLASLNHPHIAAIYGHEESDGIAALVLELVGGRRWRTGSSEARFRWKRRCRWRGRWPRRWSTPMKRGSCTAI